MNTEEQHVSEERQIEQIKFTAKGVHVKYGSLIEKEDGSIITGGHKPTYDQLPNMDFIKAMDALDTEFMKFHGFEEDQKEYISITGITIGGKQSSNMADDLRTLVIHSSKTAVNDSSVEISTGRIILASDIFGFEKDLTKKLDKLIVEVNKYLDDVRPKVSAQMTLDQQIAEQEKEAKDSASTMAADAKTGEVEEPVKKKRGRPRKETAAQAAAQA